MGEKPMGTPLEDEELGPEAGAASIITTRSNIKSSGAMAEAGGTAGAGGGAGVTGEPIPGIDTKGR
jgi:hypothetical protein